MTIAVGTKHTGKWELFKGHYLAAAFGAAVLLGTLVGVGAWQGAGTGTVETPALPTGAIQVPRNVEPALIFYIVADEAQAQEVMVAEDDAALIRAAGGEVEPVDAVYTLVANDSAQLGMTLMEIDNANGIRAQEGLPPMQVVDLR